MGFFDFLKDQPAITPTPATQGIFGVNPQMNQANNPHTFEPDAGPLEHPPETRQEPGLLHKAWDYLKNPDTLASIATAMRSAGGNENAFADLERLRQGRKQDQLLERQKADRARKNAAFKAAYQGGKFDPAAYTSALGDTSVDPSDIAELTRAFAPKSGVDGGTSYTQDPTTGETTWGEQRPLSHAEQAALARQEEQERRNQVLEEIAMGGLKVKQQNAGTASFRAHKAPSGGGASSWLPAGARVVHVPGS